MSRYIDKGLGILYCSKCGQESTEDEFFRFSKEGKPIECRSCYNKYQREYSRRVRQEKRTSWFENKGCVICGEDCRHVLDFHHLNPDEKEYNISHMGKLSTERVAAEMEKCVILCACCHRKITAVENGFMDSADITV